MTNDYARILEAAEQHLNELKGRGTRFLTVENETLRQLSTPLAAASQRIVLPTIISEAKETKSDASVAPISSPAVESIIEKVENVEEAMAELRARALACVKCPHLVSSRKNVVFGVGDIHATLMFVGEAPGADEDSQGEPFVGAAGQLLTRIIKAMGFDRNQVYIANVLKCRPDTPGKTSGNRKPTGDEMQTCLPYLLEQINIIRPKVLVALGATAIEGLLGRAEPIGRLRGHFQTFRNIPLMPTFHPSYLLHNQAPSEKRKVWEDMLQVMEKLNLPISEKQRGYFLNN